ncbi:MAG: hypothetical protein JWR85_1393 [Marmoricola sp.]|nr:hypothetical protein [Marmoricola sp.]
MGNLWPVSIASSYEAATQGLRVWADVAISKQGTLWMGRGDLSFDVANLDDGVLGVLRLRGFLDESNPYNPELFDRRGTLSLELLLRGSRAGVTRVKVERMLAESGGSPAGINRVVADIFDDEVEAVVSPAHFVVQTKEEPVTWVSVSLSCAALPTPAVPPVPSAQPDP